MSLAVVHILLQECATLTLVVVNPISKALTLGSCLPPSEGWKVRKVSSELERQRKGTELCARLT